MFSGVGDPFLNQEMRYHCPVFGIFKYVKPKAKVFTRHINTVMIRVILIFYAKKHPHLTGIHYKTITLMFTQGNIETKIISLSRECIPNKNIKVRPYEPPWLTTSLKRKIRQRKQAYTRKKAKRTRLENHWSKFKNLRNAVVDLSRTSKKQYFDGIAEKLKSKPLSPKDCWATLKTFIKPTFTSSIPPFESNGHIVTVEYEKANTFNTYFQSQTILGDSNEATQGGGGVGGGGLLPSSLKIML